MTDSGKSVIVIGGGLSGLSASTLLTKQGFRVTLIEQKNRLGGRTFSFEDSTTSETIDNGQHVMMGCYVYTLRWLGMLGQTHHLESADTIRIPFAEPRKEIYPLVIPDLPMPFHLVAGIFRFKNLSIRERFSLERRASVRTWFVRKLGPFHASPPCANPLEASVRVRPGAAQPPARRR